MRVLDVEWGFHYCVPNVAQPHALMRRLAIHLYARIALGAEMVACVRLPGYMAAPTLCSESALLCAALQFIIVH